MQQGRDVTRVCFQMFFHNLISYGVNGLILKHKMVRMTALVVSEDDEGTLQRLHWRTEPPWRLFRFCDWATMGETSDKPLPKPLMTFCALDHKEQSSAKFETTYKTFHSRKCIWKLCPFWWVADVLTVDDILLSDWLISRTENVRFSGIGLSISKIKWSWDRFIFIMGIPILVRRHLCFKMA